MKTGPNLVDKSINGVSMYAQPFGNLPITQPLAYQAQNLLDLGIVVLNWKTGRLLGSAAVVCVFYVLALGPNIQMGWVATLGIVTMVVYLLALWYWSIVNCPTQPVGQPMAAQNGQLPMPMVGFGPCPLPTILRPLAPNNKLPKLTCIHGDSLTRFFVLLLRRLLIASRGRGSALKVGAL